MDQDQEEQTLIMEQEEDMEQDSLDPSWERWNCPKYPEFAKEAIEFISRKLEVEERLEFWELLETMTY